MQEDKKLIAMLRSNDRSIIETGFQNIYEKYHKLVFHCIYKIIKDYLDTEELTNDTFISVFNNRKNLIESKNVKYYIIKTAKNLSIDYLRKKKRESETYLNYQNNSENDSKVVDIKEFLKKLEDSLNEKELDVIIKHLFEGMPFKEIAEIDGSKTSKISNIYYRALDKLKERRVFDEKK